MLRARKLCKHSFVKVKELEPRAPRSGRQPFERLKREVKRGRERRRSKRRTLFFGKKDDCSFSSSLAFSLPSRFAQSFAKNGRRLRLPLLRPRRRGQVLRAVPVSLGFVFFSSDDIIHRSSQSLVLSPRPFLSFLLLFSNFLSLDACGFSIVNVYKKVRRFQQRLRCKEKEEKQARHQKRNSRARQPSSTCPIPSGRPPAMPDRST